MKPKNIITSFSKRRRPQTLLFGFIIISLLLLNSCNFQPQTIAKTQDMNQPSNPSVGSGCGVQGLPIQDSNTNYEEAPEEF